MSIFLRQRIEYFFIVIILLGFGNCLLERFREFSQCVLYKEEDFRKSACASIMNNSFILVDEREEINFQLMKLDTLLLLIEKLKDVSFGDKRDVIFDYVLPRLRDCKTEKAVIERLIDKYAYLTYGQLHQCMLKALWLICRSYIPFCKMTNITYKYLPPCKESCRHFTESKECKPFGEIYWSFVNTKNNCPDEDYIREINCNYFPSVSSDDEQCASHLHGNSSDNSNTTEVIIMISLSACLLVVVVICMIYYIKRKKKKEALETIAPYQTTNIEKVLETIAPYQTTNIEKVLKSHDLK